MSTTKSTQNRPLSGPGMRALLRSGGIPAQKVTRRRSTGYYVAEFYSPGMQAPVTPAQTWAESIQGLGGIDGVRIIDRADTVADWRADRPVILAAVTFTLESRS
jgi:hypothetical protein